MKTCIADRKLLYSPHGGDERLNLVIRIGEPFLVEEGSVDFDAAEGVAGCRVEFEGPNIELSHVVYGADRIQALQLASNIEPTLERLRSKYDFFFPSGEPYHNADD